MFTYVQKRPNAWPDLMCLVSNDADSMLSIITFYHCPNSCSASSTVIYEAFVRQTAQPVGQGSVFAFHVRATQCL